MVVPLLMEEPSLAEDLAEDEEEADTPKVAPEDVIRAGERRSRSDGVDHRGYGRVRYGSQWSGSSLYSGYRRYNTRYI
jgi:hypothetical protein